MKEKQVKKIQKWTTRLKPRDPESMDVEIATINHYPTWVVTDFGRNLNGEFLYIVQPLQDPSGLGEGVTGMSVYALSESELLSCFDINEESE